MSDRAFFDTNIIPYGKDLRDSRKQSIADKLIARGLQDASLVVSAQVLNEFYVNATRKLKPGLSRSEAGAAARSS